MNKNYRDDRSLSKRKFAIRRCVKLSVFSIQLPPLKTNQILLRQWSLIKLWYSTVTMPVIRLVDFQASFRIPGKSPVEKSYYFSRILPQICNNLMKKIQTREQPMLARLSELNWRISGKKRTYLRGRFYFHILKNMAQNNEFDIGLNVVHRAS